MTTLDDVDSTDFAGKKRHNETKVMVVGTRSTRVIRRHQSRIKCRIKGKTTGNKDATNEKKNKKIIRG